MSKCGICYLFFFFFQAEDGIRYRVRSRGLGDVYKRQGLRRHRRHERSGQALRALRSIADSVGRVKVNMVPVSYTHLTLPTSDLV